MNTIHGLEYFKYVTNEVINWNYEPLKGISVFTKSNRYAHIEISIRKIDYHTDKIIWTLRDEFIPIEFRQEIENVLMFFGNYLTALKGSRLNERLIFDITDGSFNLDSGRGAFGYATVFALGNCFNKEKFEVSATKLELTDRMKKRLNTNDN